MKQTQNIAGLWSFWEKYKIKNVSYISFYHHYVSQYLYESITVFDAVQSPFVSSPVKLEESCCLKKFQQKIFVKNYAFELSVN